MLFFKQCYLCYNVLYQTKLLEVITLNKFFFVLYGVVFVLLLLATPYDLELSLSLYSGLNGFSRTISEMVYIPPFFIGFFGINYYVSRFSHKKVPLLFRGLIYILAIIGYIGLSYMFVRSMRFLPYYLTIAPVLIIGMIIGSFYASRYVYQKKWFEFDYLASIGMGLIFFLYFVVTNLKRLFGRARPYVVAEDESLFTEWYEIAGMVFQRDFYSIPSGHITFVSISLWFILVVIVMPQINIKIWKVVLPVLIWIAFQAYFRICLGEHYITDVLFSIIFTAFFMHLFYFISKYIRQFLKTQFNI